ncbi:hypothetical protein DDT52_16810 [Brenneria roseae subsp. roseae]|uniref:DEAD/DEAH box helicase n=1 Tax=Brenneria roseae TaxID=1509241 RepID=UPI000D6216D7|nr:ATP-binding protein [Brenneria roseae]PWC17196.1 hypothetical protein DDT52_16810 [Brenneria roseae subsp. roseae]
MDDDKNKSLSIIQALKILDYWHKIEFFESTDIKSLEDNADGVLRLTVEALQIPSALPWIDPQQIRLAGRDYLPSKKYNYELFFGIFDRKEIFARAKQTWPDIADVKDEQLQDEGRTCSVKCLVDQDGYIDGESFEFSTVTWALGQLETGGLQDINLESYQIASGKLQKRFKEIIAVANNLKKEHGLPLVLTTYEIIEFLKAMAEWTHFSPEVPAPALFIKLKETRKKKNSPCKDQQQQTFYPDRLSELSRLSQISVNPAITEISASSPDIAGEITILNSFYLRDIEKAINWIKEKGLLADSPLGRYLIGSRDRKPDLMTPDGRSLLLDKLRLSQLPAGRWPSDSAHNMSLMQQFAINTLEQELALSGLYSVNGPPGTGKTTMLRDLVASNLVKRASILASLDRASEAFGETICLTLDSKHFTIPCLSPQLAGYEMVVASNNNAAVENISRELPQQKSLGKAWRQIGYLKPVAQKLAAQTRIFELHEQKNDKLYEIKPLTAETDCWGLIAAALGKQENREIFGQRVFYFKSEKGVASAPADSYRTLVESIKQLPDNAFAEAKNAFNTAQEGFQGILYELKQLEALRDQQEACQQQKLKVEQCRARLLRLNVRLAKLRDRRTAWWTLQVGAWCRERAIIGGLERRRAIVDASYQLEKNRFEQLANALREEQQRCALLEEKYSDAVFATSETDIEAPAFQRTTFGHCQALNEARSLLTVKALELHQAWLAAAYKESNLHQAFYILMQAINGGIQHKQACMALWRLLFMIVPVVSSTFASVARQFSTFGEGDIGWLFIDEAGQATPQQAVGALWRAKRAVVVGDPLQIEPVFTIPPAFVEAIARRDFGEAWRDWSPTVQSVQNLADRVNPYGTMQISKEIWLGSPLRVHRRCDEPMFSIANAIAYNNKMLHGRDDLWPQDDFLWGDSCWFDVCGEVDGKHFVPEQGQYVLSMLRAWLEQSPTLPDAYIISPFKRVKNRLKVYLRKELRGVNGSGAWINERVGTVHTFQGKEEKNVIIVLGLSEEHRGAAKWASAKPNLLNVAVTRAQKRVYIVGSKNIWSGCQYFNVAHEKLEARQKSTQSMNAKESAGKLIQS